MAAHQVLFVEKMASVVRVEGYFGLGLYPQFEVVRFRNELTEIGLKCVCLISSENHPRVFTSSHLLRDNKVPLENLLSVQEDPLLLFPCFFRLFPSILTRRTTRFGDTDGHGAGTMLYAG